jgi:predicted NBD/HSP70 family sugar kinase
VASDAPIEHLHVRRHNLSLVLRLVASEGPCSRASIAGITGLTRATVSSLIAELIDRGLVLELGLETDQRVGRPATLLELDGSKVVTLGVELNVGYTAVLANDLAGTTIYERRRPLMTSSSSVDDLVPVLRDEIRRAIEAVEATGRTVAGIGVAVPGIIDVSTGVVVFAPNLGWHNVPLLDRLVAQLGTRLPIIVDNEANMGAVAEHRVGVAAGADHLVYVLAANGVGSGVILNGSLFRGASGAAGEIGHTTVDPDGEMCSCGSRGCWETKVSLGALLAAAVPDLAAGLLDDRRLGPEAKVAMVAARARVDDPVALAGLHEFGRWVGIGLANIVDSLNPEVIVLSGLLPELAPWTMDHIDEEMRSHSLTESVEACRVVLSTLGFSAAALGCTLQASERLFLDPTLVPGQIRGTL